MDGSLLPPRRSLLATAAVVALAACSTGGRSAAPNPAHADPGDLYEYDLATGATTRLTDDPRIDGAPAWMPDGEHLVFGRLEVGDDPATGDSEILIAAADGSDERYLTDDDAPDVTGRPTPDGDSVVFSSERDGNSEIYVVDLTSGELRRLTHDAAADRFPAVSPDGLAIAFTSDRGGDDDLYVMDVDGSDPVQLTATPGVDWLPEFSPDGTTIAFATDHTIELIAADGSDRRTLSRDAANHPSWSPDGTRIAAVTRAADGDFAICVLDVADGAITVLTDDDHDDFYPAWSPDGDSIVFTRSPRA